MLLQLYHLGIEQNNCDLPCDSHSKPCGCVAPSLVIVSTDFSYGIVTMIKLLTGSATNGIEARPTINIWKPFIFMAERMFSYLGQDFGFIIISWLIL
jgi:hypothetical protein